MKLVGRKNRKLIIILVICLIMAVIALFIGFFVPTLFALASESNTTEYEATFDNFEFDEQNNNYIIYIKEYSTKLIVFPIAFLDTNSINNLIKEQKIYFRINKEWEDLFNNNDLDAINIITLSTKDVKIITLESYNKKTESDRLKVKISGTVFAGIFILGATLCVLKIIRKKFNKKENVRGI